MEWARLEPYLTAAEPVVLLRMEREEALHLGRPFTKHDQLVKAEEALLIANACGVMIGARIMERMRKLAGSLEEEPRSRFSDAAIVWVFSHLHWWEIAPDDVEMQDAVRRYFWLGRHGGRSKT